MATKVSCKSTQLGIVSDYTLTRLAISDRGTHFYWHDFEIEQLTTTLRCYLFRNE